MSKENNQSPEQSTLSELLGTLNVSCDSPGRSWIEINFYCWYQEGGENGYIAQQAQREQQVLSRTLEGKLKLVEILLGLGEVTKQNQAILDNLFRRLTLPKKGD
jgi:hypothetical protein